MSTSKESRGRNSACVACRRLKVRCDVDTKNPLSTCSRCQSRNLVCRTDSTLAKLRRDSYNLQSRTERQLRQLHDAINAIAKHLSIPEFVLDVDVSEQHEGNASQLSGHGSEAHITIVMNLDSSPAELPGACVVQEARVEPLNALPVSEDPITSGLISEERAASFTATYQNRLDHFVYRILGDQISLSLEKLRELSPFLVSAICTVGSLHNNAEEFDTLYAHFVALTNRCSAKTKNLSIHDVQALLVGAFWLPELSWSLSGAATRIATELMLHLSIFEDLDHDRGHYLRLRLYYLVYICDHQSSILYGRPPMTQQCEAIQMAYRLTESRYAIEDDSRMLFNVELWSIWTSIYQTFGFNTSKPLNNSKMAQIQRLHAQLDMHEERWTTPFSFNTFVGHYPNKGQILSYNFAKLFLYSHGLRGLQQDQVSGNWDFDDEQVAALGKSAILYALSVLRTIVDDADIQSYFNGLPVYFDVMLAFTSVFLLKIITHYSNFLPTDAEDTRALIFEFSYALESVVAGMHRRHLLVNIVESLRGLALQSVAPKQPLDARLNNENSGATGEQQPHIWSGTNLEYLSTADMEILSALESSYDFSDMLDIANT